MGTSLKFGASGVPVGSTSRILRYVLGQVASQSISVIRLRVAPPSQPSLGYQLTVMSWWPS